MLSSLNSYTSLLAIVDDNNINLKNIITSQLSIFPLWITLQNMIDTSLAELSKNSTSSHAVLGRNVSIF